MGSEKDRLRILELAEKAVKRGKLQEAINEYQKLLTGDAQDISVRNIISDLYLKSNQKDRAIEEFYKIASFYEERGLYSQSMAVYKKIIKLNPGNIEASMKLADLYYAQGFLSEAKMEYQKIAKGLMKIHRVKEAIFLYEKLLKLDRKDIQTTLTLADLYTREGAVDKAVERLNDVAEAKIRSNALKEAKEILKKAKELKEGHSRTLTNFITLLIKEGKDKEAMSLIFDALKKNPNDITALNLLGNHYFEGKDYRKAEELFVKVISIKPQDVEARVKLGRLKIQQDDLDKAFQLYKPLVDSLVRKNKAEKAVGLLGLILSTRKAHLPTLELLASIYKGENQEKNLEIVCRVLLEEYYRNNLREKVVSILRELVKLCPGDEEVKKELDLLTERAGLPAEEPPSELPAEEAAEVAAEEEKGEEAQKAEEEEIQRRAEEERRKAEEERRMAEEERLRAQEERKRAEEETKRREEELRKIEEEARRRAQEESRRMAEEARRLEEEAKKRAEEEARRKAEEELRQQVEEQERRKAEAEEMRKAVEALETKKKREVPTEEIKEIEEILAEKEEEAVVPEEGSEEMLEMNLAQADLYINQGLLRNARRILENMRIHYSNNPRVEEKLASLDKVSTQASIEEILQRVEQVSEKESELFGKKDEHKTGEMAKEKNAGGVEDEQVAVEIEKREEEPGKLEAETRKEEAEEKKTPSMSPDVPALEPEGMPEPGAEREALPPETKEAAPDDLKSVFKDGLRLQDQGQMEEAIEKFKLASKDEKLSADCYNAISKCYRQKNNLLEAAKWMEKSLELTEEGTDYYLAITYELALLYEEAGKLEKAISLYEDIKDTSSKYMDVKKKIKALRKILKE